MNDLAIAVFLTAHRLQRLHRPHRRTALPPDAGSRMQDDMRGMRDQDSHGLHGLIDGQAR